jgi:hypothetical protein
MMLADRGTTAKPRRASARIAATGGGFLLAVLWMDLMFDVQAFRLGGNPADAEILASIASYYRRVTTDASPMHQLIGATMLATLGASLLRARSLRGVIALAFAVVPIGLALLRVFPNAVRLGTAGDPLAVQADLARAILWDHIACFAAMAAFIGLQLTDRD